jgi:hypothetical protein
MNRPEEDAQLDQVKAVLRRLQRVSADTGTRPKSQLMDGARTDLGRPVGGDTLNGARPAVASVSVPKPAAKVPVRSEAPGKSDLLATATTAIESTDGGRAVLRDGSAAKPTSLAGIFGAVTALAAVGALLVYVSTPSTKVTDGQKAIAAGAQVPASSPTAPSRTGTTIAAAIPATAPRTTPLDPTAASVIAAVVSEANGKMSAGRVQAARQLLASKTSDNSPDIAWALGRSYDPNVLAAMPNADAVADVKLAEQWYRTWHELSVQQGLVSDGTQIERLLKTLRRAQQ